MKSAKFRSILQDEKECFMCRLIYDMRVEHNLERHHIYEGTANRKISEENGFWVYLSPHYHNSSPEGVHHNENNNRLLKAICQRKYEETRTREEFMKLIGRNYL